MHDFRLVDYDIHNFVFNSSQLFLLVSFAILLGIVITLTIFSFPIIENITLNKLGIYFILIILTILSLFLTKTHFDVKDQKFDVKYEAIAKVQNYDKKENLLILKLNNKKEKIDTYKYESIFNLKDKNIKKGDKVKITLTRDIDFNFKPKFGDHRTLETLNDIEDNVKYNYLNRSINIEKIK